MSPAKGRGVAITIANQWPEGVSIQLTYHLLTSGFERQRAKLPGRKRCIKFAERSHDVLHTREFFGAATVLVYVVACAKHQKSPSICSTVSSAEAQDCG